MALPVVACAPGMDDYGVMLYKIGILLLNLLPFIALRVTGR
jgi:hypothetical protein